MAISPAVTVLVQDANGNTVPTATTAVTLALGANPGGATLGGTLTVNAVNGVATFNNLTLDQVGTGYTLTAAATGLTGATSTAFNITRRTAATGGCSIMTRSIPAESLYRTVDSATAVAISATGSRSLCLSGDRGGWHDLRGIVRWQSLCADPERLAEVDIYDHRR